MTKIIQLAKSTLKGSNKEEVYPKTTDTAVYTTDKNGNTCTLNEAIAELRSMVNVGGYTEINILDNGSSEYSIPEDQLNLLFGDNGVYGKANVVAKLPASLAGGNYSNMFAPIIIWESSEAIFYAPAIDLQVTVGQDGTITTGHYGYYQETLADLTDTPKGKLDNDGFHLLDHVEVSGTLVFEQSATVAVNDHYYYDCVGKQFYKYSSSDSAFKVVKSETLEATETQIGEHV